jgi:glutathione peroxidase
MTTQTSAFDFDAVSLSGEPTPLSAYRGKVALIVNTASRCGYTPQYAGLEQLYDRYRDRGFVVLGFPSNQFGKQEPGSNDEIAQFCEANYRITFPMFARIDVNGSNAHPLFDFLKQKKAGLLGTRRIKWNFSKFLVDRDGNVVARYAPGADPSAIAPDIERLLEGPQRL